MAKSSADNPDDGISAYNGNGNVLIHAIYNSLWRLDFNTQTTGGKMIENKLDYNVKGIKSFIGMEGSGFNATLYRGKKKVAFVIDSAQGGDYDYQWYDKAEEKILRDYCLSLSKHIAYDMEMDEHPDSLIAELVDAYENKKRFTRLCKTSTLFRIKGDEEGEYRKFRYPYNDAMKKHLRDKYGDTVVEVLNETILAGKFDGN